MLWGENCIYMSSYLDRGAFFIDLLALPVRRDFRYREEFNRAIKHLIEAGIFDHWQDLEYRRLKMSSRDRNEAKDPTNLENEAQFDDFNISQLQSFFFLYLFGIGISTLVFLGELFVRN